MNEPMFTLGLRGRSALRRFFVEPPPQPVIEERGAATAEGANAEPVFRALPAG